MFKELKISVGINIFLGILVACIIGISSYGLITSRSAAANFDDTVVTNKKIDDLHRAIIDLNSIMARVNAMSVATLINQPVTDEEIDSVRKMFTDIDAGVNDFLATPFYNEENKKIGLDIKQYFDQVIKNTEHQFEYIRNPAAYPGNLREEFRLRTALQDRARDYIKTADVVLHSYGVVSHNQTQSMMVFSICALIVAVICTLLSSFWLKYTLFNRLQQVSHTFRQIASGDLSKAIDVGAKNEIGNMLVEVEKMRLSLTETVYGIRGGVEQIYSNAHEMAASNNDLSSRTEEQASALQQTAASMEELKITVRQNADNAYSAKQLAESASTSAHKGGEVMKNLNQIMTEITVNSRQIADINSVIDSIANQTNILALNAAVEAARAGEQGRGFAVVAGEVRNLAKRSADAAKEIRQLINTCVANMNIGSQEVDMAGSSMEEIVKSVIQVTDIMAEIASASDEQSTGINQIAQAVNEMDLVTQQNAMMVEQAAKTATNVEVHAKELDQVVARFVVNDIYVSAATRERNEVETSLAVVSPVVREYPSVKKTEEQWETF